MGLEVKIYPHNDLFNLAHFNIEIVKSKVEASDFEGLGLHCKNCIISTSFAVEAFINYVGSKKVKHWNEKKSWYDKIKRIYKTLDEPLDMDKEPLRTLKQLKEIRNELAHGKPIEKTVVVSNKSDAKAAMKADWDAYLTPEFAIHAYEQADVFQEQLLNKFDISLFETLTSSRGTITRA
ncbi:TPA: hypothetical protein NJ353_004560 [Vibrio parahaemolyticus]|nr:hypothetical protein [Vibrio parahaemolyticus]HCG6540127.1 hypothetical protein [Vibrio parahaemolyticus]HCG7084061.1 hypothetical protein [Vibrio parahaemolyticus]HCH0726092.1 hypothetical protein [Vibrio parahaemolyticus]HCH0793877.1 hypothetical protein [Vibrio parahaemolyticus]